MRPSSPTILGLALLTLALGSAVPAYALFAGTFPESKCLAGKLACVDKAKSCLLKCHEKGLRSGTAADPTCLAKCRDDLQPAPPVPGRGCFAKHEAKGGCGASVDDAATFGARIDAQVAEILAGFVPDGGTPLNPCTAKKVACMRKFDTCLLKAARKAAQAGTAIGSVDHCTRILDGSDRSCVGKLEARYCNPAEPGCNSTAPACLTFDDEMTLRVGDEAFVDEAIADLLSGPTDVNTQRCSGDTAVSCASAPGGVLGCGGGLGTCEFYFGAPTGGSWGGIPVCTVSRWNGAISGTFDQASGASAGFASLLLGLHVGGGPTASQPCPVCEGDPLPNDGTAGGFCAGGLHGGAPCDGNVRSAEPSLGMASLDCPPPAGTLVSTGRIDLTNGNDGPVTRTVDLTSPVCNDAPGKRCLCASCALDPTIACANDAECAAEGAGTCTSAAGYPRKPNACYDDTATPGDDCVAGPGGAGSCASGPFYARCLAEPFRSCGTNADCPVPNDRCVDEPNPCHAGYAGNVGDAITALGRHETPRNGATAMTFASVFCQPSTSVLFLNVSGFPGPGRIELAGIGQDDGGPGCPTYASFLPTSKAPSTHFGWAGFAHDQPRIGGAKVTVAASCTGAHPSCSCSYTGPIANPNAP